MKFPKNGLTLDGYQELKSNMCFLDLLKFYYFIKNNESFEKHKNSVKFLN